MEPDLDYTMPGPLTGLDGVDVPSLELLAVDPVDICRVVPCLVVQPADAQSLNLPRTDSTKTRSDRQTFCFNGYSHWMQLR